MDISEGKKVIKKNKTMKKFNVIVGTLLLLNGVMGQGTFTMLSNNASEQPNYQAFNLKNRILNSMKNVQSMTGKKGWKTSDIFVEKKPGEPLNHRTLKQDSLIQKYDSIYT